MIPEDQDAVAQAQVNTRRLEIAIVPRVDD
jgi:hypothetical protein